MIPSGSIAYAHARIRACKGRLFHRAGVLPLFTASDDSTMHRALAAVGIDEHDPFGRLLSVYRTAIRAYRQNASLFRALLRRHEIENLKLAWRAVARRIDRRHVTRLWKPLRDLASLEIASIHDPDTLRDFAARIASTPYAAIATQVMTAHGDDLAAAEMAFDRWTSKSLLEEAHALRDGERLARRLIELVVRERDAQLFLRGETSYGLSPEAMRAAAAIATRAEDLSLLRGKRLRLCRRAFAGDPFRLAPAVAVVLLAEEEMHGIAALVERRGNEALDEVTARVLEASLMGA